MFDLSFLCLDFCFISGLLLGRLAHRLVSIGNMFQEVEINKNEVSPRSFYWKHIRVILRYNGRSYVLGAPTY